MNALMQTFNGAYQSLLEHVGYSASPCIAERI